MSSERYIPAAGRRGLTALYDPVLAVTMRERHFRRALVERTLAADPGVILDLGCGTGTLAVQLARAAPYARVIGLDGDRDVLRRAAKKAGRTRVELGLLEGSATAIPLADASVDCVVSSLLLHHLSSEAKQSTLGEVYRVLPSGGLFLLADWGEPSDPLMRAAFLAVQLLDGFENTRAHVAGELPELIERSGFAVTSMDRLRTAWGTLELLAATPS
jgi:ubiquinone/menaquinone biosynthesis C-methylase UbiE